MLHHFLACHTRLLNTAVRAGEQNQIGCTHQTKGVKNHPGCQGRKDPGHDVPKAGAIIGSIKRRGAITVWQITCWYCTPQSKRWELNAGGRSWLGFHHVLQKTTWVYGERNLLWQCAYRKQGTIRRFASHTDIPDQALLWQYHLGLSRKAAQGWKLICKPSLHQINCSL